MGELFKIQADVSSKVMLAAVATLTMEDAQFFAGWITRFGNPPCLFVFPLSEIEHPNL